MEIVGQRNLEGWYGRGLRWLCVIVIGYHLSAAAFGAPEAMKFRSAHVAMYLAIVFMAFPLVRSWRQTKVPWYDLLLFVLAWVPAVLIYVRYDYIVDRYPYVTLLEPLDWVTGVLLLVLVIEACRRSVGLTLTILLAFFLAHAMLGSYFPAPLDQTSVKPMRLIDHLFMTTSGLFGEITNISASYVLMFVLLGAMLEKAKGGDLFMNLATGLMGRSPGGPGKAAVLASGLFGSISGAAVANVYATGTFTIPLMIKTGFQKRFAAAVEAVASSSGQLVPPIMGSAAFLIADFTRTPYLDVAYSAALPAFLYLFAVYVMVHLETMKYGLPAMDAGMVRSARAAIKTYAHMGLVLVVVVTALAFRYTPVTAAFWGVLATVVLSWLRHETRLWIPQIIDAFELGARRVAPVAAALFVAALIVGAIELSGLGLRFTSILVNVTNGQLLPTMVLVMISCIILGMGLPTSAAYMIVAIFGAPALIKLGVTPLAAHFFVFYYAIISAITPPVAVAAYAAATVAETPMQATGWTAMKLGAAVYLVPFVMVYNPALLMLGDTVSVIQALVTGVVGVIALGVAVQGYFLTRCTWLERLAASVAALTLLYGGWETDAIGGLLIVAVYGVQVIRRRSTAST